MRKAVSTRVGLSLAALVVVAACGGGAPDQEMRAGSASAWIVNGVIDDGAYPQVGTFVAIKPGSSSFSSRCSGTLIGKRVFLTAAHCARAILVNWGLPHGKYGVSFDGVFVPGVSAVLVGTAHVHPEFDPVLLSDDVAVIVLDEPVRGIKPSKLARPDVLTKMKPDDLASATIVDVGYGLSESDPTRGTRRVATQHYLGLCDVDCGSSFPYWVVLGGPFEEGNGTSYTGDSGGPHFLDGRIVATTTSGAYPDADIALEWAQRVDIKSVRDFIMPFLDDDERD